MFLFTIYAIESCKEKDITLVLACIGVLLGFIMIIVCIICSLNEPESDEYPSNEYRLEYKIITQNNVSDTTYVLIKK